MSRKTWLFTLTFLAAGVGSVVVLADVPARLPQWNWAFRQQNPGKKWQYCTLSEQRLDRDRVAVFVESGGMTAVCNGGWTEVSFNLGRDIPANDREKNSIWDRQQVLNQLGEMGWELVGVHRGEFERTVWVFKREL